MFSFYLQTIVKCCFYYTMQAITFKTEHKNAVDHFNIISISFNHKLLYLRKCDKNNGVLTH